MHHLPSQLASIASAVVSSQQRCHGIAFMVAMHHLPSQLASIASALLADARCAMLESRGYVCHDAFI